MEIQDILNNKESLISYLEQNNFAKETDYLDEEYNKGTYFKINDEQLLVVYEALNEENIKEIKNHFLIDKGLSYCIIIINKKIMFFRNFGESKCFIYSDRTKDNPSKKDKLKKISEIDSLFQSKDVSEVFYEKFKLKRNLLAQNIKKNITSVQKYLLAQKIFDRFFFIYFLCHKGIIKINGNHSVSGKNLFSEILLKNGDFLDNVKNLFNLFNSQEQNLLKIGDYKLFIPYLNGGLFRPDVLEENLEINLTKNQWEEIFNFLNSYNWIIEDIKNIEENEEKILTPEILGHVYERSVVEWELGFEEDAENAVKGKSEKKEKGIYYTPESITNYILHNTIIPYLLDKLSNKYESFNDLIRLNNKEDLEKALEILNDIKVLDPACGSGAFLVKASDILMALKRRIYYQLGKKKEFLRFENEYYY